MVKRLKATTLSLVFWIRKKMENLEQRLIEIETALTLNEKYIDDLNAIVIEQGKKIDYLIKQNKYLLAKLEEDVVKPLSEETPPPHY